VVSRKISKSAVKRNRIRRRIYALIGSLEKQISQPYDIVITVFSESVDSLTPPALEKQLQQQLKAAGILR